MILLIEKPKEIPKGMGMANSNPGLPLLLLAGLLGALHQACAQARSLSADKDADFSELEGVVKTIEDGEYGILIDCIDVYKQPAFNHPLLKSHAIQMEPSSLYLVRQKERKSKREPFYQSWSKNGECPQGTIPIIQRDRRTDNQVAARRAPQAHINRSGNEFQFAPVPGVEVAQISVINGSYVAAHGSLNIWTPMVAPNETSLSQIQFISENGPQSLGAGWMVDLGSKFGNQTTFFVYWMADEKTGCFNLECSGFVQVNPKFVLGYPIQPVSTYGGKQIVIETTISKDPATGNWWLQLRDLKWGYWPASLFNGLSKTADVILWGGQVMSQGDPPPESPHTKTQMGSGHFSDEGFGKSCYIRDLWYMRSDRPWHLLGDLHQYMTRPECYDLKAGDSDKWGVYFYFGGPGYSDKCPKSGK